MKVLLINQYCGFGSTGKIVQNIYDLIVESGNEACIAYGRYHVNNSKYNTYEIGGKLNNYEHWLETRLVDNHGFASRHATKKFIRFIKEYNPDVVHIHNLHGYYINVKLLMEFLKQCGMKIIWTFHDCWNFSAHGGYIDYANGKLPVSIQDREELREYPKSFFSLYDNYSRKKEIFSGFKNMTIVTPSEWLSSMVKDTFFSQYPVKVINNGIDLSNYFPDYETSFIEKYGVQDKEIILGVASVWDNRKGLKYFVELDSLINHKKQIIVVIGKKDVELDLPVTILHIPQTTNVIEMRQWYSNATVFINPTLYENYPTTNLEAQACGTPVITFNTGGSPESLIEETGIIVDRNVNQLFLAMDVAKSFNPDFISNRGSHFCMKKLFREYLKLYER